MNLSAYTNKNIVITGGAGYIGNAIVHALSTISCDIKLIVHTSQLPEELQNTQAKITFIQKDVTDQSFWSDILDKTDYIFHLAGQTSSVYANEHPQEDFEINVLPIIRFVEYIKNISIKPVIIHAGTSTQLGYTESPIHDESSKDNPITIYDINKLTAEKYLMYYACQLGGLATSLRLTNVYGPGSKSSKSDRGIVNKMIQQALSNKPLTAYGTGEYIRDYIFIDDVVDAFLNAGEHIEKLSGKYFLIGTGTGHSILEMMTMIQEQVQTLTSFAVPINHIPMPEEISLIEKRNFIANSNSFQRKTNWKPSIPLEEGIKKTVEYYYNR